MTTTFEDTGFPPLIPTALLTKNFMGHNGPRTLVVKLYGPVTDEHLKREHERMEHRAHQLDQTPKKPQVVYMES